MAQPTTEFKPDTAYIELPVCSECEFWKRQSPILGYCRRFDRDRYPDGGVILNSYTRFNLLVTRADFGCVQFQSLRRRDGEKG